MSTTQKIELSREIRQWVGTGLTAVGVVISIYAYMAPNDFQKNIDRLKTKLKLN